MKDTDFIDVIDKSLKWKRLNVRINYYMMFVNAGLFLINCLNIWSSDGYWLLLLIWLQPVVIGFIVLSNRRLKKSIALDERLRADELRYRAAKSPEMKMFYCEQILMTFNEFNKLYGIKEDVFEPWKKFMEAQDRLEREGEEWKGD